MTGRTVRIEKLAPTGEGIARTADGVGFIDRALPGELVETNVYEVRRKFWRGSLLAVREPSPARIGGPHDGCPGCDWAHFEPGAAREAKRALFLETMVRIGKLDPASFGDLPVAPSPAGYRIRVRLHADGAGPETAIGYFAPGTHRIAPAERCEALSAGARALLPELVAAAAQSGAAVSEVAILEDLAGAQRLLRVTAAGGPAEAAGLGARLAPSCEGVRVCKPGGALVLERGAPSLPLSVGGRTFSVSVDTFFQSNRHLLPVLFADVQAQAAATAAGSALDAFGGVGLFAGALLSAGHRVTSVESDASAIADARRTRDAWTERDRWEIEAAGITDFLEADDRRFACVVADPPRAGLGRDLAGALAARAASLFLYVSCDPATLARDLPAILAQGFAIRSSRLYDLFAFTHRVESLVALERVA